MERKEKEVCCVCKKEISEYSMVTPYDTSICFDCAQEICITMTAINNDLDNGVSLNDAVNMLNRSLVEAYGKTGGRGEDYDALERAIEEDEELEDEYDLFHPRLNELIYYKYDIKPKEVFESLRKYTLGPHGRDLKLENMQRASDLFCEIYSNALEQKDITAYLYQTIRTSKKLARCGIDIVRILLVEILPYQKKDLE